MSKITEITYSKGLTIQVKQYEPTTLHFSAKAEVAEGDNISEAYGELKDIVHGEVVKEKNRIEGSIGRKGEEKVMEFTENMETGKVEEVQYEPCKYCGAKRVLNPKTGKVFCSDKCWLKNKK